MLKITIKSTELFDHVKEEFFNVDGQTIELEHSLVSISKWESKWKKPYINTDKSTDEFRDYVRCMTITQDVNPMIYYALTSDDIKAIQEYIKDPMTATTIQESRKTSRNIITNELIYYWMTLLGIPMECQFWHLNRLFTLIKVADAKKNPKKMTKRQIAEQNKRRNAERRKKLNSKG